MMDQQKDREEWGCTFFRKGECKCPESNVAFCPLEKDFRSAEKICKFYQRVPQTRWRVDAILRADYIYKYEERIFGSVGDHYTHMKEVSITIRKGFKSENDAKQFIKTSQLYNCVTRSYLKEN